MALQKNAAYMLGGALAGIVASRLLPPFLLQLNIDSDPFKPLIDDHRSFRKILNKMEKTAHHETVTRVKLLALLKRGLGKHALAEEDVVYPVLHDRGHKQQESKQLYDEHADMKIILYELEHNFKDAGWLDNVSRLKKLILEHARQEEETEFPVLRQLLKEKESVQLARLIRREEALVL